MHLLFVSVVVFLQITDYLLLKFFILDKLNYLMGTAGIVLLNNDSVDTLFNLAVRRGIVFSPFTIGLMYDLSKLRVE